MHLAEAGLESIGHPRVGATVAQVALAPNPCKAKTLQEIHVTRHAKDHPSHRRQFFNHFRENSNISRGMCNTSVTVGASLSRDWY